MLTIDASVWVNGFDKQEANHKYSRQFLELVKIHAFPVFVPNLVLAEVAGAISRTRRNPLQAQSFAIALSTLPNVTFIPLDSASAHQAMMLAAQHNLRGADSIYAAVAKQFNCTLVTLDNEHLTRLAGIVKTQTPEKALTELMIISSANQLSET